MKRENRYLVFKIKEIGLYLTPEERAQLWELAAKVLISRRDIGGKPLLECVVIENDWPEYETAWQMIERRVRQENCQHVWSTVIAGDPAWCQRCGANGPIED
ncbi:MAG: hypothetical protein WC236_15505 [Gallionellaceae bacterium]